MNIDKVKKVGFLVAILLLPSLFYLFLYTGANNFRTLPILGPKEYDPSQANDTLYHTIPSFELTNQNGNSFSSEELDGKIYVADFFFATCPTICPKMSTHMLELQKHFYDLPDFHLLSFTVNPEHDTVEVLRDYADKLGAADSVWDFLTGDKEIIYDLGFEGYMVNAMEDEKAPGGFLHSQWLVLVDKQGRIRGYFDGTSTSETNDLMDAIEILFKEEFVTLKD
ncbi:MAG: SCO family protein [Flavobacteriales bacterium]|mgnify:CR=1 FL=1|nr:SCO family protein [Flavobacteriales bacterium]